MIHPPVLWSDQKLGACGNDHMRQAQVMSELAIHQRGLFVQLHDKTMFEFRYKTRRELARLQAQRDLGLVQG